MSRKRLMIVVLAVCALCLIATGSAFAQSKVTWKAQVLTPLKSYMGSSYWGVWAKLVNERTKGAMEIKLFEPGAIAAGNQIYAAVQNGAIDAGCSYGAYHTTEIPVAYSEYSLPAAFKDFNDLHKIYYDYKGGEAIKLLDEEYQKKGTKFLSLAAFTVGFMTKFEIKNIEDVKGKKLRASGPYIGLLKGLGAAPSLIASPEQYMALQLGTIDGTLNPLYMAETYKLKEVIKYIVLPPVGYGTGETYVNMNSWKKLSDDFKKIVQKSAVDAAYSYKEDYAKAEEADIKKAEAVGVKVIRLSDKTMAAFEAASIPIWDEAAKKSASSKKFIDLLKDYKKTAK